jgi:hypothetical protein
MHFAQTSAAVHWWWVTAHSYEQQIFIGVIAVTHASCEPVLQSSTGERVGHFAKTSAAVHWWWVTAHLYEQQIFIGVIAVTQACCEPVCRAALDSGKCILPRQVLQCIAVGSLHTCMSSKAS